ncbi:hypothetical protein HPB47_012513, partial [Ixodes persulcatus]
MGDATDNKDSTPQRRSSSSYNRLSHPCCSKHSLPSSQWFSSLRNAQPHSQNVSTPRAAYPKPRHPHGKHRYDRYTQLSITQKRRRHQTPLLPPTMTITYARKNLPTIQTDSTHLNSPHRNMSSHTPRSRISATVNKRTKNHSTFLLLGDFNCPHLNWYYNRTTPLGRKLVAFAN